MPFIQLFNTGASQEVNQQAFLIAIIPHISVRCELNRTPESIRLMNFVSLCRKKRFDHLDHATFMEWFIRESQDIQLTNLMRLSFFDNISKEMQFSKSQRQGLVFVVNKLVSMGFSPKSLAGTTLGHFQPLITPEVPDRDSQNLEALGALFSALSPADQDKLAMELLLAVVVQPGEMLVERYGLNIEKRRSHYPFVRTQKQTGFFSSSESTVCLSFASASKASDGSFDFDTATI